LRWRPGDVTGRLVISAAAAPVLTPNKPNIMSWVHEKLVAMKESLFFLSPSTFEQNWDSGWTMIKGENANSEASTAMQEFTWM
jgi:hypothetical protein